jgi:amino acid adenylation domain-containing protein
MDFPAPPSVEFLTPAACSWHARFMQHTQRAPSQSAVIGGGETWTYRELAQRADQIAQHLAAAGIGRGDFVGLGLNRCLELPAALLGILQSGAAYIPLDPAYPAARIEQMIASSRLRWILTTRTLAAQFPNSEVICLEDLGEVSVSPTHAHPRLPRDLFYAIFTSGSTGQPKAAAVYQAGFENLLDWYVRELSLSPADRTLLISSPSFDLTQKNFFAPLMSGGTLVIDPEPIYDITRIDKLLRQHKISVINCTPSTFYPLVDAAAATDYAALASLRVVVLGGEPISIPQLRAWLEHPQCHAEVVNSYGPTECTDIATFHRLNRKNLADYAFVPLGREIPNLKVTLCDEALQPVALGEIGEICISGISLGNGYLHDPEQTAKVFQPPYYRSGDLAKRHPSGILEFRGRADHQVKINGFRIELGEIEIALQQLPAIREAVVIAVENFLIAYVQGNATRNELTTLLAARLPHYMIPSDFHWLETFPQTPNGKIDRLALAQLNVSAAAVAAAPSTSQVAQILELWSEVLGRPVSDRHANFFDVGGNSIHLAVIHLRLMKLAGTEFPITELFALPSAQAIADFLSPQATDFAKSDAAARARAAQSGYRQFRRPTHR